MAGYASRGLNRLPAEERAEVWRELEIEASGCLCLLWAGIVMTGVLAVVRWLF